jgi:predicted O-linked N-acetylglucosamine transferase (SPINDLY family)
LLRGLAAAAIVLSFGFTAGGAAAQTGTPAQHAQAQAPGGQKSGAAQRQAQPAGNPVEAQLADVKKKLNITAEQQPQFEQFATVVKQNAQAMETMMQQAQQTAKQNAVDNLKTAATFAQTEADNLKRLVPALEALYASLSDQQKRLADQIFNTAGSPEPAQAPRRRQG